MACDPGKALGRCWTARGSSLPGHCPTPTWAIRRTGPPVREAWAEEVQKALRPCRRLRHRPSASTAFMPNLQFAATLHGDSLRGPISGTCSKSRQTQRAGCGFAEPDKHEDVGAGVACVLLVAARPKMAKCARSLRPCPCGTIARPQWPDPGRSCSVAAAQSRLDVLNS